MPVITVVAQNGTDTPLRDGVIHLNTQCGSQWDGLRRELKSTAIVSAQPAIPRLWCSQCWVLLSGEHSHCLLLCGNSDVVAVFQGVRAKDIRDGPSTFTHPGQVTPGDELVGSESRLCRLYLTRFHQLGIHHWAMHGIHGRVSTLEPKGVKLTIPRMCLRRESCSTYIDITINASDLTTIPPDILLYRCKTSKVAASGNRPSPR